MSFVIGCASETAAIIVSDGRSSASDGSISSEDYNKTRKINDHVILGFSGTTAPCEDALKYLTSTVILSMSSADTVCDAIAGRLSTQNSTLKKMKANFIIIGIGDEKKMVVNLIQRNDSEVITKQVYPSEDNVTIVTLSPDGVDGNQVVNKYLVSKSVGNVETDLCNAVKEVAEINKSVNSHCFVQRI